MNFNFGEVLTRAWQIVWKHRVLWIFGILASCGRSSGNFNSSGRGGSGGSGFNPPPQLQNLFDRIQNNMVPFIAIAVVVFCVIWIVVAFLSTIGKIGLIRGTAQAEGGAESLLFGQLFSESTPYFWRMFGLSLVLSIPLLIILAIFIGGFVAFAISASRGNASSGVGLLASIPLLLGCLCLLIPVMIVVNMVFGQAQRAIVLDEMGMLPGLTRGWEIFRGNLAPIIVMAIILGVVAFIVGLVIAIPILVIVVPAAVAFAVGNGQNTTPLIFMAVCFCLYLPVLLVLNGVLTAYTESAWTLTYLRLTHKPEAGEQPKLDDTPPVEPEDSNKTIIATKPNA